LNSFWPTADKQEEEEDKSRISSKIQQLLNPLPLSDDEEDVVITRYCQLHSKSRTQHTAYQIGVIFHFLNSVSIYKIPSLKSYIEQAMLNCILRYVTDQKKSLGCDTPQLLPPVTKDISAASENTVNITQAHISLLKDCVDIALSLVDPVSSKIYRQFFQAHLDCVDDRAMLHESYNKWIDLLEARIEGKLRCYGMSLDILCEQVLRYSKILESSPNVVQNEIELNLGIPGSIGMSYFEDILKGARKVRYIKCLKILFQCCNDDCTYCSIYWKLCFRVSLVDYFMVCGYTI